jgi:PAS domain S-box-containing protein
MMTTPTYEDLEIRLKTLEKQLAIHERDKDTMVRQLSEDFKLLADRSLEAIYQFDIESCTFPFFNNQFLSLYSIVEENTEKVLSKKSVLLHIHPDDLEKVRAAKNLSYQAGKKNGEIEYRYIGSDGAIRLMHDRWTIVRDASRRPIAIEGFVRDMTRLKRAEKEFEHSIRNSPIGCYIIQDAKFEYVNPEFMRITGYCEDELIGTYPLNIVQQQYREKVKSNFIEMLKGKRSFPYEFCINDKHGNTKWILETATSIQYKGRRAALGYFMDNSKGKQVEKERLAKEKLLSILELAGAVGHELNNPLQVVSMCTEKLPLAPEDDTRTSTLHRLLKKNVAQMRVTIGKFQNITQYASKDYVGGKKILDIHTASERE